MITLDEAFKALNKINESWNDNAFISDNLDRHCDCLYTSDVQLKNAIAAEKQLALTKYNLPKHKYDSELCEVGDALDYMLDLLNNSKLNSFFKGYEYSIKVYKDYGFDYDYYALDIKLTNNKSKTSYNFIYTLTEPAQHYYIERHDQNKSNTKQNIRAVSHDNGPDWARRPLFMLNQAQVDRLADWLTSNEA